jgi:hypothetical protein
MLISTDTPASPLLNLSRKCRLPVAPQIAGTPESGLWRPFQDKFWGIGGRRAEASLTTMVIAGCAPSLDEGFYERFDVKATRARVALRSTLPSEARDVGSILFSRTCWTMEASYYSQQRRVRVCGGTLVLTQGHVNCCFTICGEPEHEISQGGSCRGIIMKIGAGALAACSIGRNREPFGYE